MRKVDPGDVTAAFVTNSTALMEYMGRTRRAVEYMGRTRRTLLGNLHEQKDISRLASTTFLSLYVSFETFLSDLFLAYLNRDFSQYQTWLANSIDKSTEKNFGPWAARRTPFVRVKNVAVAELEVIVDPSGRNLTFSSVEVIRKKAREWLSPAYSARIQGLTAADRRRRNVC